MKKTIKIIFAVFMSVLIICFSCVSAFADTTVDSDSVTLSYFQKLIKDNKFSLNCSLSDLPADDYLVFAEYDTYYTHPYLKFSFIPRSAKKYVYLDNINNFADLKKAVTPDTDTIYLCRNSDDAFSIWFTFDYYELNLSNSSQFVHRKVSEQMYSIHNLFLYLNSDINYINNDFINDKSLFDMISKNTTVYPISNITNKRTLSYCSSLFLYCTQLVPGYKGHIVDTSFEGVLSQYGKDCDNSILKQYKYQVTYLKNNDIVMMFLNNNKAPAYEVSDYNGQYDYSKKYKFTYANSYDAVIYFPQYQKYLTYDDWYNNKSEPNDFKWFWEEDKKSFSLISDWTVTFSESGSPSYTGTRVVLSWDEKNSVDNSSLVKAWDTLSTDTLESKGFKKGRPDDQNYPYRVSYYINNVPKFSVYFNSKPKVAVVRENDFNAEYKICLIPTYGYIYLELEDMYLPFDGTMEKYTNKTDFISNIQNSWFDFLTSYKADIDEDVWLHLFENYRGDDTHYIGTRVFFNWDVSPDIGRKPDDKFDYSKVFQDGGKYVDKNGHIHGGSLDNYDDEDLNKWNTNGKDDNSNKDTSSSSDFDFSFEGITAYCKDFWNFMQAALAIFPSFIWLLVGTSIAVLIALRLLGR